MLNVVFGVAGGLGSLALLLLMGGFGGVYRWAEASGGYGFVVIGSIVFHLVLALPCVLGGIFVLQYHESARLFMIFVSALNLLNVPFGALLGAFGLWVLLQPETEPLFLDPVLRARTLGRPVPGRSPVRRPRQGGSSDRVGPTVKPVRSNLPE